MFDLNQAIGHWRVYMKRPGHFLPDELDELESHLRETCDQLTESGISLEEAFAIASNQIGEPMEVGVKFQKNKGKLPFFATNTGFIIAALALFHLSVHVLCILFSYGASMQSFETSAEPSFGAKLVDLLTNLLSFPLVLLVQQLPIRGTGQWGWMLLVANSLLWGWAGWQCYKCLRDRIVMKRSSGGLISTKARLD